jgi:hypothetical protein
MPRVGGVRLVRARHHSIDQASEASFRDLQGGILWMASLLKLIGDFR